MTLLSLNDSLRRLEAMLLVSTGADDARDDEGSSEEETGTSEQGSEYWQMFSKVAEYNDSESDSQSSEGGEVSDTKHRQHTTRPALNTRRTSSKSQKRSSTLLSAQRRSTYGMNDIAQRSITKQQLATTSSLDLPTRIARASSEYAAHIFLRNRAISIGYSAFVEAHEGRWIRVRETLKEDLRKLIRLLTRYNGSSLLVGRTEKDKVDKDDLYWNTERLEVESWTSKTTDRKGKEAEQVTWLEAALATWSKLPPTNPDELVNGSKEAEETIRSALVSLWAQEVRM
jgi:hypothetical protein